MKDMDFHAVENPVDIIPMVQAKLVVRIVDIIMEKVGPELERILGGKK